MGIKYIYMDTKWTGGHIFFSLNRCLGGCQVLGVNEEDDDDDWVCLLSWFFTLLSLFFCCSLLLFSGGVNHVEKRGCQGPNHTDFNKTVPSPLSTNVNCIPQPTSLHRRKSQHFPFQIFPPSHFLVSGTFATCHMPTVPCYFLRLGFVINPINIV